MDGITGITVPPFDAHALARALTTLLNDRDTRMKMGEAGKARIRTEFSEERMVMRTMRVYDEVLSVKAMRSASQPNQWYRA